MKIAMVAVTRNEARDIAEWLLYHIYIGFDTMVLFDNESTDGMSEVVKPLQKLADIRLIPYPGLWIPGQVNAYVATAKLCQYEFDWIAFCDTDEFFVPVRDGDPKTYLETMDAHAQVGVNWMCYGSAGHVDFPEGLVTESFLYRGPDDFSPNRHVKSFCRPGEVVSCWSSHVMDMREGMEMVDSLGNPIHWVKKGKMNNPAGLDVVRFNHYFTRSRAHFLQKISMPLHVDKARKDDFEYRDRNDVYDPIIVERYGDVLEKIKAVTGR